MRPVFDLANFSQFNIFNFWYSIRALNLVSKTTIPPTGTPPAPNQQCCPHRVQTKKNDAGMAPDGVHC